MKLSLYPRLALDGIRKNKRLYLPYILTCIGMVMMEYIIYYLGGSDTVAMLPGARTFQSLMSMGYVIMRVFALIFLFYTNSFLIRRRKKEFGLYNILGMGKGSIAMILLFETLFIGAGAIAAGEFLGVALSKLFELALVYVGQGSVSFTFSVSGFAAGQTALWFCGIFALIFASSVLHVRLSNPVSLLRSENVGEKPPKANWLLGILGAVLLVIAYALALAAKNPTQAIGIFLLAVILVIAATYILFTAGSVLLCRLLQKNKKYYYRADHFVSVSSMAFRMKRNGAGLASICILVTMVLVTLSTTLCMYVGMEDSFRENFPNDFEAVAYLDHLEDLSAEKRDAYRAPITDTLAEYGLAAEDVVEYAAIRLYAQLDGNTLVTDYIGRGTRVNFIPLADYNRLGGTGVTLEADEVLVYAPGFSGSMLSVDGELHWRVKDVLDAFPAEQLTTEFDLQAVCIVVPDLTVLSAYLDSVKNEIGGMYIWELDFNLDGDLQTQIAIYETISDRWSNNPVFGNTRSYLLQSAAWLKPDYNATYSGMFYLGLLLSIVFACAAVLIIYYKQISEGYEDQARFEIMQKVGMTKKEIRKCVNSQMLTVLFLPLLTAGLHLCFAFTPLRSMLSMFDLNNVGLFAATTAVCFALFAVFYAVVYRLTSNAYYSIVSGARER